MRALTLDYRRESRAGWTGVSLLAAGVAGAVIVVAQYRQTLDEEVRAEGGIHKAAVATRKRAIDSSTAGEMRTVALEVVRARKLLVQMSMPWNDLFAGLEAVDSRKVALLSIESDIDKQRVKISAEAKNLGAMLEYLRDLEARPTFADVYLQSHQIQLQDAQRPVRFVLTATWRLPG